MSVEFLRTEAGRAFTSSLVRAMLKGHERRAAATSGDTKEQRFQHLLDDFMNQFPDPTVREEDLRPHLTDMYQQRFFDLYPADAHAAQDYYTQVAAVNFVLAQLTENVWLLDTGVLEGYPNPTKDRKLSVYHLQWAREALGWWTANLANLNYYLKGAPHSLSDDAAEALLAALDQDARTRLAALHVEEVEESCPVC